MVVVIIAGGSGTRLWPLSTHGYPKHLLRITDQQSLLQNTFNRAAQLATEVYVISEAGHVQHIYEQLPELPKANVIVEPARRGTASCIVAALARIKQHHAAEEPVVFMHADHHIRDTNGFLRGITRAAEAAVAQQRIVLLGLVPTRAETGFGYIERGGDANGGHLFDVVSFKEKPDKSTAQQYLESGQYLWNMGYFVAPLGVFEQRLADHAPHLWKNYQALLTAEDDAAHNERYLEFANEPIDIALIEQVPDLLVVTGSFDWMDIGSYKDLHEVNEQDAGGNVISGPVQTEKLTNSFVRNETDVPVGVIGLDNVAVVVTDNGIIVTNKNHSQDVGTVAKRIQ